MSAAHLERIDRYISMDRSVYDALKASESALRAELASYRAAAVPLPDYERVRKERDLLLNDIAQWRAISAVDAADHARICQERDAALATIDALTARPTDAVLAARHARCLEVLARLVRQIERVGGYSSHEEQAELREARAMLVEEG